MIIFTTTLGAGGQAVVSLWFRSLTVHNGKLMKSSFLG